MTAAQQKRSANKNKYKILKPFDAIMNEKNDNITKKIFDNFKKIFIPVISKEMSALHYN